MQSPRINNRHNLVCLNQSPRRHRASGWPWRPPSAEAVKPRPETKPIQLPVSNLGRELTEKAIADMDFRGRGSRKAASVTVKVPGEEDDSRPRRQVTTPVVRWPNRSGERARLIRWTSSSRKISSSQLAKRTKWRSWWCWDSVSRWPPICSSCASCFIILGFWEHDWKQKDFIPIFTGN